MKHYLATLIIDPSITIAAECDAQGKAFAARALANLASGDDAIKAALAKAGAMEPLLWRSCRRNAA